MSKISLPDMGEGVDDATITEIFVKKGDIIEEGDTIIEVETDKAVAPINSSGTGEVVKIMVSSGDTIKSGTDLIEIIEAKKESKIIPPSVTEEEKVPPKDSGSIVDFYLPELGEGIEGGTVIGILVKEGELIKEDDPIVELETDKAVIPVPSPVSGVLKSIRIEEGDEVKVGDLIFQVSGSSDTTPAPPAPPSIPEEEKVSPQVQSNPTEVSFLMTPTVISSKNVAAGPSVRKLARELGVDLGNVNGTARGGRITLDDLKLQVKGKMSSTMGGEALVSLPLLPDFSKFGEISREPVSKIRKLVSERMTACWTIPHVHQFNDIDITGIVELQKKYATDFKEAGSSLSPTQFIIKAMAAGLKKYPTFNSSFDHMTNEIIYKKYFNIGVAVDTPSGLIVPVLKDVDQMSIFNIGKNLKELAKKTRDRKVTVEEMQGASITLSNLGGIGGTSFTPIVNHPEVAIVGVARSTIKPVFINGEFQPRHILNLCVAYDHRVIDGADGARFIMYLTDYLENMDKSLLL